MTSLAGFLVAQLEAELAADPRPLRETQIKASLLMAPELARRVAEAEPGWETYDNTLRQLASRYADHPGYLEEWRPDPSATKA